MPDLNKYELKYREENRTFELFEFHCEGEMGLPVAKATKHLIISFILAAVEDPKKFSGLVEDHEEKS